ncbi:Non-essential glycogen phosphorylase [Tritrichomonas musculus]|uniref:Alpha-1,4 glucan phosphorylase n=1 Tax=Tritrichomonas musculus TaxID=1915356 RepID=A0ABR2KAS1_9EUKA
MMKSKTSDDYYDSINKVSTNSFQFLCDFILKLIPRTSESVSKSFLDHLKYTLKHQENEINNLSAYLAASYSIRDRLIQLFNITMNYFISVKAKQLYYVSSEFLIGRFLQNSLLNLQLEDVFHQSLSQFGIDLNDIYDEEYDMGPGSSGIGRYAACLLDSLASLNYPAWGYGLFYSNGYFKQTFDEKGHQKDDEIEPFLSSIKPWRIERPSINYDINFGGKFYIETNTWVEKKTIKAIANDFLIPGYHTINTLTLRLWSSTDMNLQIDSDDEEMSCLTHKIYPDDSNDINILKKRLLQEYLLSSATIQDIINRLTHEQKGKIHELPQFAAIHLNNTQPSLMAIELLRILIDEENMDIVEAITIVNQTFSFTCQSIIPMTFERWPLPLFNELLPRHLQIIYDLNAFYLSQSSENQAEISIIEESNPKQIRMINLSIICSQCVNGVSERQTNMLNSIFNHFGQNKFLNITNGVSIRKWVHHCNRPLSELITESLDGNDLWPVFNTAKEENIYHADFDKNNYQNAIIEFEEEEEEGKVGDDNQDDDDIDNTYSSSDNSNESEYENENTTDSDDDNYIQNTKSKKIKKKKNSNKGKQKRKLENSSSDDNSTDDNLDNDNDNQKKMKGKKSTNCDSDNESMNSSSHSISKSTKKNGYEIDHIQKNIDFNKTPDMIRSLPDDSNFIERFSEIKYQNKINLSKLVESLCGIDIDPDFQLFDVQAKEFKHHHRQSLHIFSIIYRYLTLVTKSEEEKINVQPRAFIIAGKASPCSKFLKEIVLLINNVANVINDDESLHNFLRVAFIPNYNVSIAEVLVAGADVNDSISTPCMEAAATSNMKFALNGSLIVGTRDGTNIELSIEKDDESMNVFFFGYPEELLEDGREGTKTQFNEKLKYVFDAIKQDQFGPHEQYENIISTIENYDYDLISADFDDYLEAQEKVDLAYQNESNIKIENRRVAAIQIMEKLSSDRAAVEYAEKMWNIKQYPVPIKYVSDDEDEI